MSLTGKFVALCCAGVLAFAACGDDDSDKAAEATATTQASGDLAGSASAVTVSANNSSEAELEAAFKAAGIPNAKQWAHEVEEYRPYPEDDPSFAHLREELAKYNPDPAIVEQIVATLTLP